MKISSVGNIRPIAVQRLNTSAIKAPTAAQFVLPDTQVAQKGAAAALFAPTTQSALAPTTLAKSGANQNVPGASPASADFNADGFVDFFDYDGFVGAYEKGSKAADFNRDGKTSSLDYELFVREFENPSTTKGLPGEKPVSTAATIAGDKKKTADFNGDGFVDFFDYDAFVADYEKGTKKADFNGDGKTSSADYDAFVKAFDPNGTPPADPVASTGASAIDAQRQPKVNADFNGDGFIDFFDYDAFVGASERGDQAADLNRDGKTDSLDYKMFIKEFEHPSH